jgi:hypothetical protein
MKLRRAKRTVARRDFAKSMSSKSKINQLGGNRPQKNNLGLDMRWRASRLENVNKNKGIKNIKKAKKTN